MIAFIYLLFIFLFCFIGFSSVMVGIFWLLALCEERLYTRVRANQIVSAWKETTLSSPSRPSNWLKCEKRPSSWNIEDNLSHLQTEDHTPANKRTLEKHVENWFYNPILSNTHKITCRITPLLIKLSCVTKLFWNNLQTKHDTFKVISLCYTIYHNKFK